GGGGGARGGTHTGGGGRDRRPALRGGQPRPAGRRPRADRARAGEPEVHPSLRGGGAARSCARHRGGGGGARCAGPAVGRGEAERAMNLRERLVLTFLAMTLILIVPAVNGLFALRNLRELAYNLSTRDAVGALALGRLQAAFEEAENRERIYLALAGTSDADDRMAARRQVEQSMARIDAELDRLSAGGYREAASRAVESWEQLRRAIAEEQRLVESGNVQAADSYRDEVVEEAFDAMDGALDPIGAA